MISLVSFESRFPSLINTPIPAVTVRKRTHSVGSQKVLGRGQDHGPLPLPGGGVLAISEEQKETIKLTTAAYNVLTEVLGGNPVDLMGDGLTIGKTKLGELVKKKAPKGEKGKAIEATLEKLRKCGAVSVSHFDVLKAKKGDSNAG